MTADELQRSISQKQPDLLVGETAEGHQVTGMFRVEDEHGIMGEFLIEATLPHKFPDQMPTVKEIGGRIPLTDERHANKNKTICYMTPEDYMLWSAQHPATLLAFLDGPLRDYFASQLHFEQTGTWPFGDRRHGPAGRVESYCDLFGVTPPHLKQPLLTLKRHAYKGHHPCPCGSNTRIRECHPLIIVAQRNFPIALIEEGIRQVEYELIRDRMYLAKQAEMIARKGVRLSDISPLW